MSRASSSSGLGSAISAAVKETMPAERRRRLDAIGFEWDPFVSDWEEGFAALEKFTAREGHCRVQRVSRVSSSSGVGSDDNAAGREKMPAERRQRLDAIGFEWDPLASDWEEGLAALEQFKAREGHCRVPRRHVEGEFKLGSWVSDKRSGRENMPAERRQRLEAIGFEWDPLASDWEEALPRWRQFKAREGHCRVPRVHVEGEFKLGSWVSTSSAPPEGHAS